MAYKILIPQDIAEEGKRFLQERGYEIKIGSGTTVESLRKDVEDCAAIVARTAHFPAEVLRAGRSLRVVSRHGVGVDNVDVAAATELGIWVTFAPESNASSVAEHTVGLLIATARNFVRMDREMRAGNFEVRNQFRGVDLDGKLLGIVGGGRVGRQVARKAIRGLDMKVLVYDPAVREFPELLEAQFAPDMETVFREADFVTLHIPSLPENRNIVGRRLFELMKTEAYFINTARGDLVVEEDLVAALETGRIAGAGLDVYKQEPPVKDSPLFGLDNVVLTPHSAALTRECSIRMSLHAAMGIDDVLSGRTPKWAVNRPVRS